MAVQESLAKVEEYNAAIELPYAGIVGIEAYLGERHSKRPEIAGEELRTCLELCGLAEKAIENDQETARRNVHIYSAFRTIFSGGTEQDALRKTLISARDILAKAIAHLEDPASPPPLRTDLVELAKQMRWLADKIRQEIPRDAYLASIVGATYPGPAIRR